MIELYYTRNSCSAASHITLEEIGVPYTAHFLDFQQGEQKSPKYLDINPKGKVPALKVGNELITENVAIQYYLATAYPQKNLMPAEGFRRAEWLSLISWLSNTVHPDARHITRPENYCDDPGTHESIRKKGRQTLATWLSDLDTRLRGRTWLMGDQYTTADPYALVFFGIGKRCGVPVAGLENYRAWKSRMLARPAVRKVLENETSDILDD